MTSHIHTYTRITCQTERTVDAMSAVLYNTMYNVHSSVYTPLKFFY